MSEINMDKKVNVYSIAPWDCGFPNLTSHGDTMFSPNSKTRMRVEEIIEQVSAGNKLIGGLDEIGSHATLIVEDDETRKYLEFDSEDGKRLQNVISKEKIIKWFELKTEASFEKNIKENVITRAEKQFLLKAIKDLKLDSYEKIEFCKSYCKFSLRDK